MQINKASKKITKSKRRVHDCYAKDKNGKYKYLKKNKKCS